MPGDGLQNHIPVLLYRGIPSDSPHTIALDDAYDYVITDLAVLNLGGTNPTNCSLNDSANNMVWQCEAPTYGTTLFTPAEYGRSIVLPNPTALYAYGDATHIYWSISGYLVVPAAATVLPT